MRHLVRGAACSHGPVTMFGRRLHGGAPLALYWMALLDFARGGLVQPEPYHDAEARPRTRDWARPEARPAVRLSRALGDHMVVQSDAPVNLWGWTQPGWNVSAGVLGGR